MKKLLALVLALVLAFGMATVAFANPDEMTTQLVANPGKTYYIGIELAEGYKLSDLRVKSDFTEGKSLVKISLEKNDSGEAVIKFDFAENWDVNNKKLSGKFWITDKYGKNIMNEAIVDYFVPSEGSPFYGCFIEGNDQSNNEELFFEIWPDAMVGWWHPALTVNWDEFNETFWQYDDEEASEWFDLPPNVVPTVIDFKDEVEKLKMKLDGIDAQLDFKMYKQGKVNMAFTTKPPKALMTANPDADISFLNFLANPDLDFSGDLKFFGEKDKTFVYLYKDGKLIDAKATWSEDDVAYIVRTSKLGAYVVSDKKLVSASATEDNNKENPGMGASGVVNVAVVAVAISLFAAGAVAFKKASR